MGYPEGVLGWSWSGPWAVLWGFWGDPGRVLRGSWDVLRGFWEGPGFVLGGVLNGFWGGLGGS